MAGSLASGATVATYRSVLVTWLRAHTATPASGASTQPSTISSAATTVRQRCRAARPVAPPPAVASGCRTWRRRVATSARSRSSSARSSPVRAPWPSMAPLSPLGGARSSSSPGDYSRAATPRRWSAVDRLRGRQGVDVDPQDVGDDREQRRRIKAEVSRTFGLGQDIALEEAVQQPAELGPERLCHRRVLQAVGHLGGQPLHVRPRSPRSLRHGWWVPAQLAANLQDQFPSADPRAFV